MVWIPWLRPWDFLEFQEGFPFTKFGRDALYGHCRNAHGHRDCFSGNEFDERFARNHCSYAWRWPSWWSLQTTGMTQPMLVQTILVNTSIWLIAHPSKAAGVIPVGHFSDISSTIAENLVLKSHDRWASRQINQDDTLRLPVRGT